MRSLSWMISVFLCLFSFAVMAPSVQANGGVLICVDTPTRILGDIYITGSSLSNCTFKFLFWTVPK